MGFIFIIFLLIIVIVLVVINTKIVPQANAYVVERLGAYHSTWETGFHIAIPIIDRVSKRISLKESVADFPPQPVITKDNVTMQIDTVIYMQVTDPKFFMYGVDNPMKAIENLTATTLRNIIGGDRSLGNKDKSCGIKKYYAAAGNSKCHGTADESGT
jgi:regulator of protease activity HflC (stomatin/prohibitin superfamily)